MIGCCLNAACQSADNRKADEMDETRETSFRGEDDEEKNGRRG